MRKIKFILTAIFASLLCLGSMGCSSSYELNETTNETTGSFEPEFAAKDLDSKTREELASLASADKRLTGELENKTIKWLSDWDINASNGASTPTDLAIFQERYGGEVQYYQCVYEQRYDQLTNYINSDEGIDFFYAGNFDAFPKGAIRGMFVPYDEYIDLDSELWKDVKDVNDSVAWKDGHYMAVVQMTGDNCAVIYNRDTVQELGFEDPAELYRKGQWNWDIFEEMLTSFVNVQEQRYGLDGWWFESALSATVGVPYVGLEDGKLVSHLTDSNIERVQNFMYDLYTKDCIAIGVGEFGWKDKPEYIGEGKELFYPVGLWKIYGVADAVNLKGIRSGWKVVFGENAMFVPMPKDPEADEYYIPANMNSYCFVKGGKNPEGVAKYLDCKRLALLNEDIREIADQQFTEDYGWSEEMVAMKNEMDELAIKNPVVDFKNGITTDLDTMFDNSTTGIRASGKGIPWSETLGALKDPVQTMIDEANNS
ncbi:MAG: ABC transporter substrate-binding protein [Oscillospiraceae bacterium]